MTEKSYIRFEGMCWPNPYCERIADLEWQLRHRPQDVDPKYFALIATFLAGYRDLCSKPPEVAKKLITRMQKERGEYLRDVEKQ